MKNPDAVLGKDKIEGCFTLLYDTLGKNKYAISIGTTAIIIFMVSQSVQSVVESCINMVVYLFRIYLIFYI